MTIRCVVSDLKRQQGYLASQSGRVMNIGREMGALGRLDPKEARLNSMLKDLAL